MPRNTRYVTPDVIIRKLIKVMRTKEKCTDEIGEDNAI